MIKLKLPFFALPLKMGKPRYLLREVLFWMMDIMVMCVNLSWGTFEDYMVMDLARLFFKPKAQVKVSKRLVMDLS